MRLQSSISEGSTREKPSCLSDWALLVCLCLFPFLSFYDGSSIGANLPTLQAYFATSDTATASISTFISIAHGLGLATMWLFGDMLPRRTVFLLAVALWVAFAFSSVLVTENQFWLFVLLRALSNFSTEMTTLSVAVIQADRFKGKKLTLSLMGNMFGTTLGGVLSSTVNSIFVSSGYGWKIGFCIAPSIVIFATILTSFFLKSPEPTSSTKSTSLLSNAFGMLRSKSYVFMMIGNSLGILFAMALTFWLPTLVIDAFEAFPDTFTGLSYSAVMSLIANVGMIGMTLSLPVIIYLSQTVESGSGMFRCLPSSDLAMPLTLLIGGTIPKLCYFGELILISVNFPLTAISFFFEGFSGLPLYVVSQQIIITLALSHHRASAISLMRLAEAVVRIPSSLIIGALSDALRGDETSAPAKFYGLRNALLCVSVVLLISTVTSLLVVRYYQEDLAKAQASEHRHTLQSTPLISRKSTIRSVDD